jgi:hypothetical protein
VSIGQSSIPAFSDLQIGLFVVALFAVAFIVTALVLAAAVKGTSSVFAFEHPKHLILWSAFVVAVPPTVALMAWLVHKAQIGEFPRWGDNGVGALMDGIPEDFYWDLFGLLLMLASLVLLLVAVPVTIGGLVYWLVRHRFPSNLFVRMNIVLLVVVLCVSGFVEVFSNLVSPYRGKAYWLVVSLALITGAIAVGVILWKWRSTKFTRA